MKTFSYNNHEECCFAVSNHLIMRVIDIKDLQTNEVVKSDVFSTYFDRDYAETVVTITNDSDDRKMTNFLRNLGVVTEIIESCICTDDEEEEKVILDICNLNVDVFKEYSLE